MNSPPNDAASCEPVRPCPTCGRHDLASEIEELAKALAERGSALDMHIEDAGMCLEGRLHRVRELTSSTSALRFVDRYKLLARIVVDALGIAAWWGPGIGGQVVAAAERAREKRAECT